MRPRSFAKAPVLLAPLFLVLAGLVAGCSSSAAPPAAGLGDPLKASSTFPAATAGVGPAAANVSVCHGVLAPSDAAVVFGTESMTAAAPCPDLHPGNAFEILRVNGRDQVTETIEVMPSANVAQTELTDFTNQSTIVGLMLSPKSNAPFHDLAAEIDYADQHVVTGGGDSFFYHYGLAIRQGCALITLDVQAHREVSVQALRQLVSAALSRLAGGIQPYVAS